MTLLNNTHPLRTLLTQCFIYSYNAGNKAKNNPKDFRRLTGPPVLSEKAVGKACLEGKSSDVDLLRWQ